MFVFCGDPALVEKINRPLLPALPVPSLVLMTEKAELLGRRGVVCCIMRSRNRSVLSVSPELLGVAVLPVGSAGRSLLHGLVSLLVHASGLLAGGGDSAELSVLHGGSADPIDTGVATDGLVGWVNHDDFVELEGSILSNPVRVEGAEVGALAGNTLLSDGLVGTLGLDLLDATRVSGLTVDGTLGAVALTATSSDANTVDNVTLLGLESKSACLLGTGRSVALVDDGKLTELPGSDSHNEAADITLLLSPKLLKVLVGSHLFAIYLITNFYKPTSTLPN